MTMTNNLIDRLRTPIPLPDRILEIVAGVMLISMLVTTAILYDMSPDTVPSHFSFTGKADGWSDKSFYWQISCLFALFMLIDFISAYYTEMNNVRITIRKKNMNELQKQLNGRMCRVINIGLAFLWCSILLSTSSEFLGIGQHMLIIMFITSIAFIAVPVIYYRIRIIKSNY